MCSPNPPPGNPPPAEPPSPGAAAADVPLEDLLSYRICILAKMIDRRSAAMLERNHKLGVADWRVLAQLAVLSPSTVRGLAARMRVDRAEVSRAAAALIARGLVRRMPDPGDARSVLFSVTAAGRALYRQVLPSRVDLHRRLLAVLTPDQARALDAAVTAMTVFLDAEDAATPAPRSKRATARPTPAP